MSMILAFKIKCVYFLRSFELSYEMEAKLKQAHFLLGLFDAPFPFQILYSFKDICVHKDAVVSCG